MDNPKESTASSVIQKTSLILVPFGLLSIIIGSIIGISDNPPGIILVLIGLFTILFSVLGSFGKVKNSRLSLKLLYWAPRTLCIVTAMFLSIFSLDVFNENLGFWMTLLALLMHLIPTFLMIIVLVISWRVELVGAIIFNLLGLLYIGLFWGRFPIETYFLIAGPLMLTGILFLLNWIYKSKLAIQIEAE